MNKATVWFSGNCSPFQYFVYWAVLTLVMSFAGPFGTYAEISLSSRFLFWSYVIFVALAEVWLAKQILMYFWPNLSERTHTLCLCVLFAGMFAAFPICHNIPFNQMATIHRGEAIITAFAICALSHSRAILMQRVEEGTAAQSTPRLIQRLPQEMQGQLLRLTARDHYVEVHTDRGVHLLLMRLRDATAEAEADGIDGFCVHRSHWVMREAIDFVEQMGARQILHLKDGTRIPIGQKYRQNVEEAGYL